MTVLHMENRSNWLSVLQQIKSIVDLVETHRVRDEIVKWNFTTQIIFNEFRNVLGTVAAKKCSLDRFAHLKLTRRNFELLTRWRYANEYTRTVASCSAVECSTHQINNTDSFECIFHTDSGQLLQMIGNRNVEFRRIDEFGCSAFFRNFRFTIVDVNCKDLIGTWVFAADNCWKAKSAESKDGATAAWSNLCSIHSWEKMKKSSSFASSRYLFNNTLPAP